MTKLGYIIMPEKDKSTDYMSHLTIGKIQAIIQLSGHIKTKQRHLLKQVP
jgi:hypothetical protein